MTEIYTKTYKITDRQKLLSGLSLLEKGVFSELEDKYLRLYPQGFEGDLTRVYRECAAIGRYEREAVKLIIERFYTLENGRYRCQFLDEQAEKNSLEGKQ